MPGAYFAAWETSSRTRHRSSRLRTRRSPARLRPRTLDELVGQEHVLGQGSALRLAIAEDRIPSLILHGPPGSGKTTLALNRGAADAAPLSCSSRRCRQASPTCEPRSRLRRRARERKRGARRSCLWTRSIASTRRNRTRYCGTVENGTVTLHRRDDREPVLRGRCAAAVAEHACSSSNRSTTTH